MKMAKKEEVSILLSLLLLFMLAGSTQLGNEKSVDLFWRQLEHHSEIAQVLPKPPYWKDVQKKWKLLDDWKNKGIKG